MAFTLPKLDYSYDALEPYIDARTMEIHYSKHHQAYTDNLNKAIKDTPLENLSIEDILKNLDMSNAAIRNNGGGFYNHNLFWKILSPASNKKPGERLSKAIDRDFGSFEKFKELFSATAASRFGSGWAWLTVTNGGLKIFSTANQDNPLMPNTGEGTPILALDVWEHAYYLKYQNKRPDYISAFFNIINWDLVDNLYGDIIK